MFYCLVPPENHRLSKSHGRFIRAIGTSACHEVMITSPLGLVPRDLEEIWPAGHYDVPVTGDWTGDELSRIQRMLDSLIDRHSYKRIINHSGFEYHHQSIPVIDTREGDSAGSHEALERLSLAVKDAVDTFSARGRKNEKILSTICEYFSKADENRCMAFGMKVRGKPPRYRLELDNSKWHLVN